MDNLPKVCVILGAGASNAVWGPGSIIKNHDFQPPLAKDLFNINEHEAYFQILQRYPGAVVLAQQLAPLLTSGQISIEEELTRYSKHPDQQIRSQFKHIPPYLRDLIYTCTNSYSSVPSSYVQLSLELLAERPHDVLFLVLNYDNLLEMALTLYNRIIFKFNRITDYVSNDRQAKVVKLHGSINWFKRLSAAPSIDWAQAVDDFDISQQINEHEFVVTDDVQTVSLRFNKSWLYPILTAPLATKGVADAVCPNSHIAVAEEFLSTCQKFLIIGTSGLDQDLLSILDTTLINSMTYHHVHIVGLNEGADQCRDRFEEGVKAFKHRIDKEYVFQKGFQHYLQNDLTSFTRFPTS